MQHESLPACITAHSWDQNYSRIARHCYSVEFRKGVTKASTPYPKTVTAQQSADSLTDNINFSTGRKNFLVVMVEFIAAWVIVSAHTQAKIKAYPFRTV